ncbi:unnamed protein product [Protopolystoma xenopodis]|uniref:Uncharacterized protein n=1 Tax=Protopolystoma xenopodis TaxID=117903 RepID=A0A448XN95_9PLAT|nr:unnamed protein product [Protopolystoma xenopodis]
MTGLMHSSSIQHLGSTIMVERKFHCLMCPPLKVAKKMTIRARDAGSSSRVVIYVVLTEDDIIPIEIYSNGV